MMRQKNNKDQRNALVHSWQGLYVASTPASTQVFSTYSTDFTDYEPRKIKNSTLENNIRPEKDKNTK